MHRAEDDLLNGPSASKVPTKRVAPGAAGQRQRLAPLDPSAKHARVLTVAQAYVCANPQEVEILYSLARAYFELQRWEEAAVLFLRVADGPPEADVAIYAAQLGLEALNVLASTFGRSTCFDDLEQALLRAQAHFCEPNEPTRNSNSESCKTFETVRADLGRLRAKVPPP